MFTRPTHLPCPLRACRGAGETVRHAPSSLFVGSPLRPGCATSSPRLRAGPPPHALYPFAQTAGVQHGQCANPLLSVRGQSPLPWLRHPHPRFTRSTPPTHPPPLCTRDGGTAQTVRHPPPFRSQTIPSARVAPPPTPSLCAPPRPHTRHAFAHMPEAQGGQCASPSFRAEGTAPTFRSRAVPPARPPLCAHARVAGGTACPPFRPRQSPLLGLRPPRPACAPSPFVHACRGMVRPRAQFPRPARVGACTAMQ